MTNVDLEANEIPDAPAADWMSMPGYPVQVNTTSGQLRPSNTGVLHKRIRVRVAMGSAGCMATVRAAWLGMSNWVELKE